MQNKIFVFLCWICLFLQHVQNHPSKEMKKIIDQALNSLSAESQRRLAEKIQANLINAIKPRQDDEDEESTNSRFPEIVPGILKVVGSALSGNATALIDSSTALIPPTVQNYISGALDVIVNTINNARPTTPTPKTTEAPTTAQPREATTVSTKTTDENEDYEEESTTEDILRSNSTRNSTDTTEKVEILENIVQNTTTAAPATTTTTTPTTSTTVVPSTTTTPKPKDTSDTELILQSLIDPENKASWATLLFNNSEQQLDIIDSDNKANWLSLLGSETPKVNVDPPLIVSVPETPTRGNSKAPAANLGSNASDHVTVKEIVNTGKGTFGQKLNALLSINKPDLVKFNPNLGSIIKLMNFIMENNELLKANGTSTTETPAGRVTSELTEASSEATTQKSAQNSLFGGVTNLNYAEKFQYGESTTEVTTTEDDIDTVETTEETTEAPTSTTEDDEEEGDEDSRS